MCFLNGQTQYLTLYLSFRPFGNFLDCTAKRIPPNVPLLSTALTDSCETGNENILKKFSAIFLSANPFGVSNCGNRLLDLRLGSASCEQQTCSNNLLLLGSTSLRSSDSIHPGSPRAWPEGSDVGCFKLHRNQAARPLRGAPGARLISV